LLQVCEELTSEQIAKQLHIAPATVETHRQNIAKKLGTNSVVGQVRAAVRGGLVDP
jgi:DNA-binding CsgD family transcriptional regulator